MNNHDNNIKFSVIVASYNYEKYIRKTLDSLKNQTYKNFEVIVIDDGSKDNSISIIKEYINKYDNFYLYIHKNNENRGLSKTIQLGISKVKGEYICFCESDDYLSEDYLQEKYSYIKENNNPQILINGVQEFDDNGKYYTSDYITEQESFYRTHPKLGNYFCRFLSNNNGIATFSEVMVRTNLLKTLDFNTPIEAWLDWWLYRQLAVNYPIAFIDKKLTFWNRHQGSFITVDEASNNQKIETFLKLSNMLLIKQYDLQPDQCSVLGISNNISEKGLPVYKRFITIFLSNLRGKYIQKNIKNIFNHIFSIKYSNNKKHIIIRICFVKFKVKSGNIDYDYLRYHVKTKTATLVVTHELSYTGAPLILIPVIDYLKSQEKEVVVISLQFGPLFQDLEKRNIPVYCLDDLYNQQQKIAMFARKFRHVICNTIMTAPIVFLLNDQRKKLIWWVHEGVSIENYIQDIPVINGIVPPLEVLKQVDRVFAVSEYARDTFCSKYVRNVELLQYGIKDTKELYVRHHHDKVIFTIVGVVDYRKAQDLVLDAVKKLSNFYKNQIQIDIVGNCFGDYAKKLRRQVSECHFINFKGIVHFEDKNEIYKNTDVLICVSRDDPFPVVVSDAMMYSIPCIVSTNVGQSRLITDNCDGFVVQNDNVDQLKNKIEWCVDNKERLPYIGEKSRKIYEKNISIDQFEKRLADVIGE